MFESVYPPVFGLTGRLDPSFKIVLESPCIHNQFVMLVDSYDITLVDSYDKNYIWNPIGTTRM
jgi:hypothetical protein